MDSKQQKSQEKSKPSPKAKADTSSSSRQVPYETYLRMGKEERAAIPYERRPFRLTPDEIESLRQDFREAEAKLDFSDLFK